MQAHVAAEAVNVSARQTFDSQRLNSLALLGSVCATAVAAQGEASTYEKDVYATLVCDMCIPRPCTYKESDQEVINVMPESEAKGKSVKDILERLNLKAQRDMRNRLSDDLPIFRS